MDAFRCLSCLAWIPRSPTRDATTRLQAWFGNLTICHEAIPTVSGKFVFKSQNTVAGRTLVVGLEIDDGSGSVHNTVDVKARESSTVKASVRRMFRR